ncbi:MAG: ATP-binding cassette domain-containing protein [Gammaproteobacteria bacterium]|nr:ATP-binding cassette domain-containing protein [Gammaproteobacteria bacterium]
MTGDEPLMRASKLTKEFPTGRGLLGRRRPPVQALCNVSLTLERGRTLGVVGESGCGKTTLARLLCGLAVPTSGEIRLGGEPLDTRGAAARAAFHRRVQLVFQNPMSSLNPRKTVGRILAAPLGALGGMSASERREKVSAALEMVGLEPDHARRHPHEFSGGQAQRIAIARALIVEPELVVLDEAVSSLDVTVQARILELLRSIQSKRSIAFVFISHDLSVVESISHDVAVMYLGRVVEIGPCARILGAPRHPYTRALISAVPVPGRRMHAIELTGEPPSPANPPTGCVFHPRCYRAESVCRESVPPLVADTVDRPTACFFAHDSAPRR